MNSDYPTPYDQSTQPSGLRNAKRSAIDVFSASTTVGGTRALRALAIGALAVGALALGALAIGRLAVGFLAIGRARIRRLEIEELDVRRLRVTELEIVDRPAAGAEDTTRES
jgi:hypothetical protein